MSSPLDLYADRLEMFKKMGREYGALCPCHPDTDPSLTITEKANGDLLIKCFPCGANGKDVAKALGLPASSLFANPSQKLSFSLADADAEYLYRDTGGSELYIMGRFPDPQRGKTNEWGTTQISERARSLAELAYDTVWTMQ